MCVLCCLSCVPGWAYRELELATHSGGTHSLVRADCVFFQWLPGFWQTAKRVLYYLPNCYIVIFTNPP